MELNPIFLRHLRGAVRRNTIYWLLALYLILVFAFFLLVFSLSTLGNGLRYRSLYDFFTMGQSLFWVATATLLITSWLFAPLPALGMLAGERGGRTLPLLQLTTYPRLSITLGKMGAALLEGGLFIIAPLPIFFYGFWIGGISLVELFFALVLLLATFLGSVAIAMIISAYANSTIVAVLVYYGLIFLSWMVSGTIASTVGVLSNLPSTTPFVILAIARIAPLLLSGLYPISAAVATEVYWVDQHRWLLVQVNLPSAHTLYLPSPWLIYTLLVFVLALWSVRVVTRRLHRKER